jgi:hypothetical protein
VAVEPAKPNLQAESFVRAAAANYAQLPNLPPNIKVFNRLNK